MSVNGKLVQLPVQPYRPSTASSVFYTEASTQMTVSPRSLLTPSPQLPNSDFYSPKSEFHPCATPNNSRATTESEDCHQALQLRKPGHRERESRTSRADMWLRHGSGDWEREVAGSIRILDLEKELKSAKSALVEKDKFVQKLQQIIINLEGDLKQAKVTQTAIIQENQSLVTQLHQTETTLKEQVNAAIQRLSALLAESFQKLKTISQPSRVPDMSLKDSQEFCAFLLEENRKLTEDLKTARKGLREGFVAILEPLVCELATIKGDIGQLRTLVKGVRSGEHLRLDVLWGVQKSPETAVKSASYSLACMQEVTIIKEAVADMKKIAADLYAEQCGQACAPQ